MYEMADQSWRDRPRRMLVRIARHTAARIGAQLDRFADRVPPALFLGLLGQEAEALVKVSPRARAKSPGR
jgi:hypothetical protein